MKCNKCGAIIDYSYLVFNCPNCNEPYYYENIKELFFSIINQYGLSILNNSAQMIATMKDIAPKLNDEIELIRITVNAGCYQQMLETKDLAARVFTINRCLDILTSKHYLSKKHAMFSLSLLGEYLGWDSQLFICKDANVNDDYSQETDSTVFSNSPNHHINSSYGEVGFSSPGKTSTGPSDSATSNNDNTTIKDFFGKNSNRSKIVLGGILVLLALVSIPLIKWYLSKTNDVEDFLYSDNSSIQNDNDYGDIALTNNNGSTSSNDTDKQEGSKKTTGSPSTTAQSTVPKAIAITGATISGNFMVENQKNLYTYKAPATGRYRFDLDIDNVNYYYSIVIKDSKSAKLASGTSSSNSKGVTVSLEKDISYTIEIAQNYGLCSYSIMIGVPNASKNVSGTEINGSITYTDQKDIYYYIAPIDGYYRFDLDISNTNNNYKFSIYDSKEQQLRYCTYTTYNDHGVNVQLKENAKYRIEITQDYRLCDYSIRIGVPTVPTYISDNSVDGKMSFIGKEDTYYYDAPTTGRYIFKLSTDNTNSNYKFKIYQSNKTEIRSTSYYQEKNKNTLINLQKGEEYTVIIEQDYLLSSYAISIIPPAEPISITGNYFSGSFEYKDQYFTYQFSVDQSGTYSIDFEQPSLDFVIETDVIECSTGNTVKTSRIYRGNESFYAQLEAGKQYYLRVFYDSDLKSFAGSINYNG